MADWIYVDNSNVFIEGKRVSAVKRHFALDIHEAINNNITDNSYRLSFSKLRDFVSENTKQNDGCLRLFGSRPPITDNIWNSASEAGYEVLVIDRNIANKEKKVDISISTKMIEDSFQNANNATDVFTLISGDGDFVPTVQSLKDRGFKVDVVFWEHASQELIREASNFYPLDAHLNFLSY